MKTNHLITFAAATLALAGCYGSTGEGGAGGATLGLVEADPLPVVARDVWTDAPAGCEDRLAGAAEFGVAEGEPALVVALTSAGEALCVDALEAVDLELRDDGADPAADELCQRYLAVLQGGSEMRRSTRSSRTIGPHEGDPSPQPNLVELGADRADPSPQPNLELSPDGESKTDSPGSAATPGESSSTTTTTTTTPRSQPGPQEGDPSPQPNSQAMQAPAPTPS